MPRSATHLPGLEPCPGLPIVEEPLRAASIREAGSDRGGHFYLMALRCAQSLWLQGLPAQSILLLNRAFSADLSGDEKVLLEFPLPYSPLRWIMEERTEDRFLGNPRRHFQHLATRMVEPRKELRSWRAWACWWIACEIFPEYPADDEQLQKEGIVEPERLQIEKALRELGLIGEVGHWQAACRLATLPFQE